MTRRRTAIRSRDPRRRWRLGRLAGGAAHCTIPAPGSTLDLGDTLYIPWGFRASVLVVGRDEGEVIRDIDAERFVSSDTGIFTLRYERGTGVGYLYPVTVGTATLTIAADADAGAPDVPLSDAVTVIVHRIATRLVFYYTEEGATDESLVPLIAGEPALDGILGAGVPINRNFTLRVEGQDDLGNVVPLTSIVWIDGGGGNFHLTDTTPADPYRKVLVTDAAGSAAVTVTADGNPNPAVTASLEEILSVSIADIGIATHLTETYSLEPL